MTEQLNNNNIDILKMHSAVQDKKNFKLFCLNFLKTILNLIKNNSKLSILLGGPGVAYSLWLIYLSIEAVLS